MPTACARVDCLTGHGYKNEALALAVSVVRSIKYWQKIHLRDYESKLFQLAGEVIDCYSVCTVGNDQAPIQEGWIGHPLDPINNLFETLMSASESKCKSDTSKSGLPGFSEKAHWTLFRFQGFRVLIHFLSKSVVF